MLPYDVGRRRLSSKHRHLWEYRSTDQEQGNVLLSVPVSIHLSGQFSWTWAGTEACWESHLHPPWRLQEGETGLPLIICQVGVYRGGLSPWAWHNGEWEMFTICPNFLLYSFMLKTRLTEAENLHFIAFYFHEDKNICYHFFFPEGRFQLWK